MSILRIVTGAFLALAVPVLAQGKNSDLAPEVRGITLGSSMKLIGKTAHVESVAEFECYRRIDEDLHFHGAKIVTIKYCYYEDQLGLVSVEFLGFPEYGRISATQRERLGEPDEDASDKYGSNGHVTDSYWNRPDYKVRLGFSTISDKGLLQYYYMPVIERMIADRSKNRHID